jgi:hypothetical protein
VGQFCVIKTPFGGSVLDYQNQPYLRPHHFALQRLPGFFAIGFPGLLT